MGPLRAYLDAALASLKSCSLAPSTPPPSSHPTSHRGVALPLKKRRPTRVERSSSARLGDLELVRTLAPALFGEVLLCADRRGYGYVDHGYEGNHNQLPLVAVKRVELASARTKRTLERGVRVAEDLEHERAVHYALVAGSSSSCASDALGYDAARDPLGSRNLLLLREEIQCRGSLFLVFDYCARGDLFDKVRTHSSGEGRLPERTARVYLRDVVRALVAMKARGFAHRDISLENVMLVEKASTKRGTLQDGYDECNHVEGYECNHVEGYACTPADGADEDEDACCYLGDFGLAVRADRTAPAGRVGKTWYMAPEVFAGDRAVDPLPADVWSLGVLLCIMLTGAPLVRVPAASDAHFRTLSAGGGVALLLNKWFPTEAELSADARALLAGMLDVDPSRRLTLEQIADHPFLDGRPHCGPTADGAVYNGTEEIADVPRRSSIGGAVARSVSRALSKTRFSWASTSSTVSSEDLDTFLSC